MEANSYKNALTSVQELNHVDEHVKNYRPQILVLSALPSMRPALVDFAYLITKNLSLLVCGQIVKVFFICIICNIHILLCHILKY